MQHAATQFDEAMAPARERRLGIGAGLVLVVVLAAVIGPFLLPLDPLATSADRLAAPSFSHPFGTDEAGRDLLARTVHAARIDLLIAVASATLSAAIGVPYGAVAGYSRGHLGGFMMRVLDVLQSFPAIIFAMMLVVVSGQTIGTIVLSVAFVNAPVFARLARATTLSTRDQAFVKAAICSGCSKARVLVGHVLLSFRASGLEQFTTTISLAVLITAGLSFVGAGVRPPTPEWGAMVSAGARVIISGHWWPSFFPGLSIILTSLGFAVLGGELSRRFSTGSIS